MFLLVGSSLLTQADHGCATEGASMYAIALRRHGEIFGKLVLRTYVANIRGLQYTLSLCTELVHALRPSELKHEPY